ncbi:MAG: hypothetical protein KIS78_11150 [Labilithrix sp.]|nr:hypothetical protein [Labilithrix sp.]
MPIYANLGGGSNVASYEHGPGWIEITFRDRSAYLYNEQSAGASTILRMQQLADGGHGLNAYINRWVKKRYAAKIR